MPTPRPGCAGQALAAWHSLGAAQGVPAFGVGGLILANPRQGGCSLSAWADGSRGMSVVQHAGFLWDAGCLEDPPQHALSPARLHTALYVCPGLGPTGIHEGTSA